MNIVTKPNLDIEKSLGNSVIGVDEAGRGPLAGPVVASAIIIDDKILELGINDSKKLSEKKRHALFEYLIQHYDYGIGIIDASEIDEINILQATMKAMRKSIAKIDNAQYPIIIDGNFSPIKQKRVLPIIKGDSKSLTIASASILAKVTRDNIMAELDEKFPMYNWHKNKGYGTKEHIELIRKHGPSPFHRKSFIKKIIS